MGNSVDRMQRFVGRAWDEVKGSLYRNAIFIMLSPILGSGLGFFFWLVATRIFRTPEIGDALALFGTLGFLAILGLLGQNFGIIRFLPEATDKNAFLNTSLTLTGIACLVLSAVFLLGLPLLSGHLLFVLDNPVYIVATVLCTLTLGFAPLIESAAIALRRADISTWQNAIFAGLKIPIAVLIVLALPGRLGVFLSFALAIVAAVLIVTFLLLPRILPGYRPRPQVDLETIRPAGRFNLGNYPAHSIGAAGGHLLPLLILNALGTAGRSEVTYFYVALVVAGLLYVIPGATFTSFYAEASHRGTDRRAEERKAAWLAVLLSIPAIAGLWLFSEPLLGLFGDPAYAREAVTPMRIISIGVVPGFLSGMLTTRVRIRKETRPLIVSATVTTGITLGLGWLVLVPWGIEGLAVAYVVAQAVSTLYLFFVVGEVAEEAVPTEPLRGAPPLD